MKKIIISYIPVLHEGYRKFLTNHSDAETLYIFGEEIIKRHDHLAKEIRALDPNLVLKALKSWRIIKSIKVLKEKDLEKLNSKDFVIVIPSEDITLELAEKNLTKANLQTDNVFLRWDKHNSSSEKAVEADQAISRKEFDRQIIVQVRELAEKKSSDWWRRVGAAIIKDGKILMGGYNRHVPSPHTPYSNGDPRNNFHKGINADLSTALHAEAGLIAEASKKGLNLSGCFMYVSTFPCPPCAKLIAYSGITKLFYTGSYGMLDGADVLKSQGVELIFVDTKN